MTPDVLVVGGGPTGLAAATELRRLGVGQVMLAERSDALGGVPRHCGHSPFGMREFGRVLGGRAYGDALAERAVAAGVDLRTRHGVVSLGTDAAVEMATPDGPLRLAPRRIVFATGIREASRAARLLPGTRPGGIVTTGALQDMVYLRGMVPFRRPAIIGSELVTLSALLTCRSAGIRPVALVEEEARPRVGYPLALFPPLLGMPVHFSARLLDIAGGAHVESVTIALRDGSEARIACDGIVLTGRFQPEAGLLRMAGVEIDGATGGPAVDARYRTSMPQVFAAGNVMRAVRTAGQCWSEGRRVARAVAASLEAEAGR